MGSIENSLNQVNQSVKENVNEKFNELPAHKGDAPQNNSAESFSGADTMHPGEEHTTNSDKPSDPLLGLVSDVLDRFPDKQPLEKHPVIGKTLKPTISSSETVFYHRISIKRDEQEKNYAVPKFSRVNSDSEVRGLEDFYIFPSNQTGGLNGKLEIIRAAEIFWDEDNQAWRLNKSKKGIISVRS